jgi:hypothetical protein
MLALGYGLVVVPPVAGAVVPEAGGVVGAVVLPEESEAGGVVGASVAGFAGAMVPLDSPDAAGAVVLLPDVAGAVVVLLPEVAGAVVLPLEAGGVAGLFSLLPQLARPRPAANTRLRAMVFDFIACSCSIPQRENVSTATKFRPPRGQMPFF